MIGAATVVGLGSIWMVCLLWAGYRTSLTVEEILLEHELPSRTQEVDNFMTSTPYIYIY